MIPQRLGFVSAHIAAFLFGLTGVLGALIHGTPVIITFGRAFFAILALGAAAFLLRISLAKNINFNTLKTIFSAGLALAIHWFTFFIAIKTGGVAVATLGFASFPAFITLLEYIFLKESIGKREWFLLFLVLFGLVLVTPSADPASASTAGLIWGVISGFAFAVLAVMNRKNAVHLAPVQLAFWQNLVVAALTLPFIFSDIGHLAPRDYFWIAILGIFCTALSHYLFVFSLRSLTARTTGLIIALEPVYAIVVAWIIFAEEPTLRMIIGGILIITAAVFPKKT
ncbi:DMT family transporter [Advenella sp. WQ 585]|uniref:DMT family transporter n=1 Tax=Advenella mandrilli TaxID=2800330 RepID=A0ABS1EA69_9BURK|nr:DMT family transporter [Advenella mandrilli]MBK1780767.1 DMT family transporter [Advenella mandrilli]